MCVANILLTDIIVRGTCLPTCYFALDQGHIRVRNSGSGDAEADILSAPGNDMLNGALVDRIPILSYFERLIPGIF